MSNTAASVLEVAQSQIGTTDGTKYGRWYARVSGRPEYAAIGTAWCAMFVSWVFDQAGATCAGIPGAYCPTIYAAAKAAGATRSARDARAGDVVLFDWDGGNPDHVGVVESNTGAALATIEGNVAGAVRRRTRAYSTVKAVIRPSYDATEAWKMYGFATVKKGASGATVKLVQAALNVRSAAGLAIDGYCGGVTDAAIRTWQRKRGLVVDGICGPVTWASLLGA